MMGTWSGDPQIAEEIERAQQIVSLNDNWDGEGAQGYSQDTFDRAVKVLGRYSSAVRKRCGRSLPVPTIGAGPDGTIDIYWKTATWALLFNIPVNPNDLVTYSGKQSESRLIKGNLTDVEGKIAGVVAEWVSGV